ncbi:MAG: VOC family protein [Kofleriaceae bacterium]
MAYQTNRFCWHGCISTNVDASKAFYSEVMGWRVKDEPMGDSTSTLFSAGGTDFGHVMAPPMPGMPSMWDNYLRVENIDETTAKAVANGGKQIVPGTDIPPGRFSVVASPSGAVLSLFREAGADAKHHPGGEGSVHWVELHSKDVAADLKWLKETFGFTTEDMPIPDGTYTILKSDGEARGGVTVSQEAKAPSMWLTWFEVKDVDDTVKRATSKGGEVLAPIFEMPKVGRMSILRDPTGGVFGVIKPG